MWTGYFSCNSTVHMRPVLGTPVIASGIPVVLYRYNTSDNGNANASSFYKGHLTYVAQVEMVSVNYA